MTATILGYVLIPVSLFFFLVKPVYLLTSAVIFIGFSGSAVLLIGDLGIQPSYWFVMLWIISRLINGIRVEKIKRCVKRNIYLFFFVIYASFSIILPLILDNNIVIMNVDGNISQLVFTTSNITQLTYLWFSYASFILFSVYSDGDQKKIDTVINYYLYGAALVCIICFYQIVCFKTGMPFDKLFRQNIHGNVQGTRIYGPCIEASMLCYYLLTVLPLSIRKKDWKAFVLLIAVVSLGVYSFSSTFIVGFGIWIIFEFVHALKKGKIKVSSKEIKMITVGYTIMVIVLFAFENHVEYAFEKLLTTVIQGNISGIQRNYSFKLLMKAFMKSPILGVGFGTCRGNDLFSTWLAGVGVVGGSLLTVYLFKQLFRKKAEWNIKVANALVWFVMLLSVPEPYNLFVWLLLALIDASHAYRIEQKEAYGKI